MVNTTWCVDQYCQMYHLHAHNSFAIRKDILYILKEDHVACVAIKHTDVELLDVIGLIQLNTSDNKSFKVNHSINGVFLVQIYTYLDGSVTEYYYATKSEQRIPRRFDTISSAQDYIMNTYSTEPLADAIFALPDYCTKTCPATTVCGKFQSLIRAEK